MNLKKSVLIGAYVALSIAILFGEEEVMPDTVETWFSLDAKAFPYHSLSSQIIIFFERAKADGIPLLPLFEKLKEGASKRVSGAQLVSGLEQEKNRLVLAKDILHKGIPASRLWVGKREERMLKNISAFLSAGLSRELIENILVILLRQSMEPEQVVPLCALLVELYSVGSMEDESAFGLVEELLSSRYPASGYGALFSFFLKAKSLRMADTEIVSLMRGILKRKGGIIQMEQELNRRRP